jgi:hypothetical protein
MRRAAGAPGCEAVRRRRPRPARATDRPRRPPARPPHQDLLAARHSRLAAHEERLLGALYPTADGARRCQEDVRRERAAAAAACAPEA